MTSDERGTDGPVPYGPPGDRLPPSGEDAAQESLPPPALTPPPTASAPPPPPPGFDAPPPIAQWAPPPGIGVQGVAGAPGLQYGRTLDRVMAWMLDSLLIAIPSVLVGAVIVAAAGSRGLAGLNGPALVATVITVGVNLLYFVAFWTGDGRATPGMRVMKLQIGDAATGAVLTVRQGLIRWVCLGGAISILASIPGLTGLSGFLGLAWELTLLATTAGSPTKQGLHDRVANTAIVQPLGARTPAMACLAIVIGLFVLWIVALVALVVLGVQAGRVVNAVWTTA